MRLRVQVIAKFLQRLSSDPLWFINGVERCADIEYKKKVFSRKILRQSLLLLNRVRHHS
jgi:hypothetical protein